MNKRLREACAGIAEASSERNLRSQQSVRDTKQPHHIVRSRYQSKLCKAVVYNLAVSTPPHTPAPLYKPFEKLVKISILGKEFEVPEGNMLLRAFQYLSPDDVAMGRFCWNEECQYCRVKYDLGEGTQVRTALSCKTIVQDGMRVVETASEIHYCLRKLGLERRSEQRD
jgi:hypothetical protein